LKITHQLAQQIVDRTINILGKNINIMDENGYIIGTGDRSRLNKYHEGAALVIKNKKKLLIYPENKNHLIGVKPGVNLPIEDQKKVIGVVGITGNPDEVGPFGEVIKMTVEMMLQQQFLLKEIDLERQAKENFIHDLISGRIGNDSDLFVARGQIVGYDITLPRVALLINIFRFEKTARRSMQEYSGLKEGEIYLQRLKNDVLRTIRDLFIQQPQDIVAYVGGDRFVVLKIIHFHDRLETIREKSIKTGQKIKETILAQRKFQSSIGIGEYHPGIKGIVRSYREAWQALEIGDKVNRKTGIHHIAHLGISRLLAEVSPETRKDFIHNVYQDNHTGKKLKPIFWETLQAFFEHSLNITDTAKEIYVHRNTLLYRLERIKDFTGLDPRRFDHAMQLYITLKMRNFQEE
jgi:carbohydrate diacid regulator